MGTAGRAFVAGATGYTGREVVRELASRGLRVVAHVRPDSMEVERWRERFTDMGAIVDTTPWQAAAFQATLQHFKPTHVFGLLGTTRKRARAARKDGTVESYETVDYGLSALLLHATLEAQPDAKFIYLSSVGVREDTRNPYLGARWRMESELEQSGLRYIIARPALITGPDREELRVGERAIARVVQAAFAVGRLIGFRSVTERFATLTGKQLARALVNAALDPGRTRSRLEVPELMTLAK